MIIQRAQASAVKAHQNSEHSRKKQISLFPRLTNRSSRRIRIFSGSAHQINHNFTSQINTGMEHTTKVKGPTVRSDLYNISTTFRSSHDHPDPIRIALTATFTENQGRLQKQKSPPNLSVSKQLKPIHLSPPKEHRACNST